MDLNRRLPHVNADRFSMVPRSDVPRSTFVTTHTHKTTFDAGKLIPIYVDEVLPGDVFHGTVHVFCRLFGALVFPIMDNMYLETFYFFVPNRLVWSNWRKLMGEQDNPNDSTSFTVPQVVSPTGGFPVSSIYDYFGLPTVGQVGAGNTVSVNVLPIRAYNLIFQEWFRDQNLQNAAFVRGTHDGNGPDLYTTWNVIWNRNKKHDYFTSCLPWPLKGGIDVSLPMNGQAWVKGIGAAVGTAWLASSSNVTESGGGTTAYPFYQQTSAAGAVYVKGDRTGSPVTPQIYADLSTATGATINALRLAFQTQRLLERDARGGTRYTELIRSHFGVISPDARLQRPEYIGGGKTVINTSAIPQTSGTGASGTSAPLGALGATALATDQHSFSYSSTEHGYIIGLAHASAELTYQQGLRKMWSRLTRYDFYWPVFAFLGEQAVLNKEIYTDGSANDALVFGYQERWAEYRHFPSIITGLFRSTSTGSVDPWHLSLKFTGLPALNNSFIQDTPPLARVLAAGSAANGMQLLFDSVFKIKRTRPMPMFSVPGNIDRF